MSKKRLTLIVRLALVVPMLLAFLVVPAAATGPGGAPTVTSLSSSDDHSAWGQTVTFTATVVPAGTGTVQFKVDGTNLGSAVSLVGVTATTTTSTLSPGTHTITAEYSGDITFAGSTSLPVIQEVDGHLRLKKTAHRDIIPAGWVIHYTIRVTNDTSAAANVMLVDTLPRGVKLVSVDGGGKVVNGRVGWKLSVPAGATRKLHVSVRPYTTLRGTIINSVRAEWGDFSTSAVKLVTVVAP